jgi:hypothetical protein
MPTAAARTGDLSGVLNAQGQPVTVIDPTNGLPFPGNVIPQSRISPQAAALLNFYPLPNFDPTARFNYQVALIGPTSQDALQSRLNKMINPRNFLNGTFAFQRVETKRRMFGFRTTSQPGIEHQCLLAAHLQQDGERQPDGQPAACPPATRRFSPTGRISPARPASLATTRRQSTGARQTSPSAAVSRP